jgi:hypothetical protein
MDVRPDMLELDVFPLRSTPVLRFVEPALRFVAESASALGAARVIATNVAIVKKSRFRSGRFRASKTDLQVLQVHRIGIGSQDIAL